MARRADDDARPVELGLGHAGGEARLKMKVKEFLAEFEDHHFPSAIGPEIGLDAHDPPFTRTQLRKMERQNLIVMNREATHFRLTLKAANVRGGGS